MGASTSIIVAHIDYMGLPGVVTTGVGGWLGTLPVSNVALAELSTPARASSTSIALSIDLGVEKTTSLFAIPKHNLSGSAFWRVRASNDANLLNNPSAVPLGGILYDSSSGVAVRSTLSSTTIDILNPPTAIVVDSNLDFREGTNIEIRDGGANYINALVTSFDLSTRTLQFSKYSGSTAAFSGSSWVVSRIASTASIWEPLVSHGIVPFGEFTWGGEVNVFEGVSYLVRPPALALFGKDISARYYRVDIEDPSNTYGYIDLYKLVISPAWQPDINIDRSWSITYIDKSKKTRSYGSQLYVEEMPQYRVLTVDFKLFSRQELMSNLLELDRVLGTEKPILVILTPSEVTTLGPYSIYGSQRSLTKLIEPYKDLTKKRLTIQEWI